MSNNSPSHQPIRFSIPLEGIVFCVIFVFVATCAVLRSVNLLVVISGMMLAAILFSWRISRHHVRNVVVNREIPERIHVGQGVNFQWLVDNRASHAIFNLKIVDSLYQITSRLGVSSRRHSRRNSSHAVIKGAVRYRRIKVGETAFSSFRMFFCERGQYEFGTTIVESRFPMALVRSWFRVRHQKSFWVAPQLGQLSSNYERLFSAAEQTASRQSALLGAEEDEFFALREWRSGDSQRKIHWRTSAKYGQPMIKQYQRVSEQHRAVIVDLFADPAIPEIYMDQLNGGERALSFATTVLSRWLDRAAGKFHLAIHAAEPVYLSSQQSDFSRACLEALASAQNTAEDRLDETFRVLQQNISMETDCLLIGPRDVNQTLDGLSYRPNKIRCLDVNSKEFNLFFQTPKSLLALNGDQAQR